MQQVSVGNGTGERSRIPVVGALVLHRHTLLARFSPRRSARYFETVEPVLHFTSEGIYQKNSMGQSRLRLWPSTAMRINLVETDLNRN